MPALQQKGLCTTLTGLTLLHHHSPRGLHPGLICSTPPGWCTERFALELGNTMTFSRWLGQTRQSVATRNPPGRPCRGRKAKPRVRTLGMTKSTMTINPVGVEQLIPGLSSAPPGRPCKDRKAKPRVRTLGTIKSATTINPAGVEQPTPGLGSAPPGRPWRGRKAKPRVRTLEMIKSTMTINPAGVEQLTPGLGSAPPGRGSYRLVPVSRTGPTPQVPRM